MKLSKHYYAIELAKRNNRVYFLSPSTQGISTQIRITASTKYKNLYFVHFNILIPYFLKFKWPSLFQRFMNWHAIRIGRAIDKPIDIVWDFDCNFLFKSLAPFQAKLNIFHPVDQGDKVPIEKKPDIIFSVSNIILNTHSHLKIPTFYINHGLCETYLEIAKGEYNKLTANNHSEKIEINQIGYIGNLKNGSIDREVLSQIIRENIHLTFHFFGPYELNRSEKRNKPLKTFISFLKNAQNVKLYGLISQEEITQYNNIIQAYLAIYKKNKYYNADNSHKIMEYLSTGKIVISNFLSVYNGLELLNMPDDYSNKNLPLLFKKALCNWIELNTPEKKESRLTYAINHSYENQLRKIEKILNEQELI